MKLLFATTNEGKLSELRDLVRGLDVEVVSLADVPPKPEVDETGESFLENARLKAEFWEKETGLWALADDSGLCVEALGGAPGVRSARFAPSVIQGMDGKARDAANNAFLIEKMQKVPADRRGAWFQCALVLVTPHRTLEVEGRCNGRILPAPRGTGGFGYDPLFEVEGQSGRTMAELSKDEKNRISHRARAFQLLRPKLEALLKPAG